VLAARLFRSVERAQAVEGVPDDVSRLFLQRDGVGRVRYVVGGEPLRAQVVEPRP
jgi:hypothetical protein